MDHSEDVERLFSWLKAPMVHYREFAPEVELSTAVTTWPVLHKAAVETGVAGELPAPQGDAAARERLARSRMMMPSADAAAPEATVPVAASTATPGRLADRPASEPSVAHDVEPSRDQHSPPTEPVTAGFEAAEPRRDAGAEQPAAPVRTPPAEEADQARYYPARERNALFGGEYREPGRDARAAPGRPADRQDRSLDAVFSRLSGGRDRLPDPRVRSRTTPGLGAVFGRLR